MNELDDIGPIKERHLKTSFESLTKTLVFASAQNQKQKTSAVMPINIDFQTISLMSCFVSIQSPGGQERYAHMQMVALS